MSAALLPLLGKASPYIGSFLLNRLGAGAAYGRQKALMNAVFRLLSPEMLGTEANKLFGIVRQSPVYSNLQRQGIASTNTLANTIQANLARAGLGQSGLAAYAAPAARTSFANTMAGVDADLFSKAMSEARESLVGKASFLTGGNFPTSIGAGAIGGTLKDMTPAIYDMLKNINWDDLFRNFGRPAGGRPIQPAPPWQPVPRSGRY